MSMVLFCNVGWMKYYKGLLNNSDSIVNGGRYPNQRGHGHEICNFLPYNGYVYGYVQAPSINIAKINEEYEDKDKIDNATVIWTATPTEGGRRVIGWYRNATVYRNRQRLPEGAKEHRDNKIKYYFTKTESDNAVLLPIEERKLRIEKPYRSVWFAENDEETINKALKFISDREQEKNLIGVVDFKEVDQEKKVMVEKSAVDKVKGYYENKKYKVISVENDNCGWDLEVTKNGKYLKVEVKGLSGSIPSIELTPNEYRYFSNKDDDYRLAIVTSALDNPCLYICRYNNGKEWLVYCENEENNIIEVNIEERTGAKVTLRRN